MAAYIRRRCLTDERMVIVDGTVVRDLYREINAIGNNINQMARYANTDRRITHESIARLESWLEVIYEQVDTKLGGL